MNKTLLSSTPRNLLKLTYGEPLGIANHFNVTDDVAEELIKAAVDIISSKPCLALELYNQRLRDKSAVSGLLQLLRGKIPSDLNGCVIEVVGEASAGKSHLCYSLAVDKLIHNGNVIWIDTEFKFNPQRLSTILFYQFAKTQSGKKQEWITDTNKNSVILSPTQDCSCQSAKKTSDYEGNCNSIHKQVDDALQRVSVYNATTLHDMLKILTDIEATRNKKWIKGDASTCLDVEGLFSRHNSNTVNNNVRDLLIIDSIASAIRYHAALDQLNACEFLQFDSFTTVKERESCTLTESERVLVATMESELKNCLSSLPCISNDHASEHKENEVLFRTSKNPSYDDTHEGEAKNHKNSRIGLKHNSTINRPKARTALLASISGILKRLASTRRRTEEDEVSEWKKVLKRQIRQSRDVNDHITHQSEWFTSSDVELPTLHVVVVNQITTVIEKNNENPSFDDSYCGDDDDDNDDENDNDNNDENDNDNDNDDDQTPKEELKSKTRNETIETSIGDIYSKSEQFISSSNSNFLQPALGLHWYHTINVRILLTFKESLKEGVMREISIQKSSNYSDTVKKNFSISHEGFTTQLDEYN